MNATRTVPTALAVLELTVHNHPGVMSHVCGLFARRACNVEGIVCLPLDDGSRSRIWLQVPDTEMLEPMTRQVRKLEDVIEVVRHDDGHVVFTQIASAA
ncbi:acetolactate synthase small subunit [Plasticicumulans acidivorans]|uniref:acetolactate synthase n=1 Tax=Plasticicumulans acidivorans TaxID=886464 RepID=A0A317MZZ7_9GAMM|nr:acetolactate synthase small subunit [Plasticicumulans acidivorans]PWV61640.1 acetolactate synthase small subunit [Plasticicumulans acidivorans]